MSQPTPDMPASPRTERGDRFQRQFNVHDQRLSISTNDDRVLGALAGRLANLPLAEAGPPDLALDIRSCGAADAGIARPLGRSRQVYRMPNGEATYDADVDQLYVELGERIRVLAEPSRGFAQVSVVGLSENDYWALTHPLFTLPFIEMAKRRRLYSVHAAALSLAGKGVLVPGTSGSGKSTLTLALVRGGFGFLGDDLTFLSTGPAGLRGLGFPANVDVTADSGRFFPELAPLLAEPCAPHQPKRSISVANVYQAQIVAECRPTVLLFPTISKSDVSVIEKLSDETALVELLPNVLLTDAVSSQAHLDVLAELVRTCSSYRLLVGRDFDVIPDLVRELIGSGHAAAG